MRNTARGPSHSPVQSIAVLAGAALLLLGAGGAVSGIAAPTSVPVLHAAVHLLLGATLVACAWSPMAAKTALIAGGIADLTLWVGGLAIRPTAAPLPEAWLPFAVGVAMMLLGAIAGRDVVPVPAGQRIER